MVIFETTAEEFDALFCKDNICYNTGAFNELNRDKCDRLYYLLFKDKKARLGMIAGLKGKSLLCPFSAPFGGFSTNDKKLSIGHIEDAVEALNVFCKENDIENLSITLPPLFYDESFLTKVQHVLFQKDFSLEHLDLNYVFYLKDMMNNYITEIIPRNGREKLIIALSKKLRFEVGNGDQDIMEAYRIIRYNREIKDFPLRMSEKDMLQTAKLLQVDSFIVKFEEQPIASAIIYHVTNQIVQVIYWGDIPEYRSKRTMNYLSYKIFEHYYLNGFELIDVGTAMLNDKPNYSLCSFKESIGCNVQPKCTFSQQYCK